MYITFFLCVLGVIAVIPLHFLSVEHLRLQTKYGIKKGTRIGEIYSFVSGWGFFLFWIGIWISPQVRFAIPIFEYRSILVPLIDFSIPVFHLLIFIPFFVVGAWFGIKGVEETGLKAAETHRSERIVTANAYSIIRHPQYVGGLLAHIGISFLLSAWYSMLSTPLMIVLVYLISRKEEEELIKEFGKEYEEYRKKVPMFIPRFKKDNSG